MRYLQIGATVLLTLGLGAVGAIAQPPTPAKSPILLAQVDTTSELLNLTNAERSKVGLPPLRLSGALTLAAQRHAEDMVRSGFFSHTGSDGSSMVERVRAAGYTFSYVGENIAAGNPTAAQTMQQWMQSPGHRANILKPEFAEIGFGFVQNPNAPYRYYWVEVFGSPLAANGETAAPIAQSASSPVPRMGMLPAPPTMVAAQPGSAIATEILQAHNQWRRKVGVPPLKWSNQLANYAQQWANQLVAKGRLEHRSERRYGENLFWSMGRAWSPTAVVDSWGSEVKNYTYANNQCRGVCGHYTQVVWRDTTEVGCAVARKSNQEYWVCNYNPPGNYIGRKPY